MSQLSVKVCGITRVEDAKRSIALGADLLGLNFWPRSPRFVDFQTAESIVDQVRGKAVLVGVWVDPELSAVQRSFEELGLDLAQLHGDESPEVMRPIFDRALKAFRVESRFGYDQIAPWDDAWGYLFDCAPQGVYGGSGRAWPYERIAGLQTFKPQILAGGIGPANLAEAVGLSGASMVDICSSVEAKPGIKDPEMLEDFFREVRHVQEAS